MRQREGGRKEEKGDREKEENVTQCEGGRKEEQGELWGEGRECDTVRGRKKGRARRAMGRRKRM
jgi:hypothetical protein